MPPSKEIYPPLLSLAVHEFRTPVSVVSGYLRMLQGDAGGPLTERQRHMIDEAEKSCKRLVAFIAELSDIGKLDDGQVVLAVQPLDLFALVGEVAPRVEESRDRGVALEVRGDAEAPISGDATRLKNAVDALFRAVLREKNGPCTVVAERRREVRDGTDCAVIVVAEEANLQEVYTSTPGVFDEKRGGLGLALPLARRVIEGHGGRIWSPALREGADHALARGSVVISMPVREFTR
jgi:signal transduction histidine kinase